MSNVDSKFVGIQISPISFVDEGVEGVLDTLQERIGVNVLMIGTISWLGLKVGRRISWEVEGFPDHGVQAPMMLRGGSYLHTHPEYYKTLSSGMSVPTIRSLALKTFLKWSFPRPRSGA